MLPGFIPYAVRLYIMLCGLKYVVRIYIISRATLETFIYICLDWLADIITWTKPFQTSIGCRLRPSNYNAIPALCDCTEPLAIWRNPLSPLGYKQRFFQPLQDPLGAQRPSLSSPLRHKGVFLGRAILSRSRSSKEEPRIFVSPFLQRNKYMELFSLPVDLSPI